MARQKNDGRGRIGGRAKGTPNKVTSSLREWLTQLINQQRKQIVSDLEALEPKERLQMLERLMQYVVPKQQAMRTDFDFESLTDEQLNVFVEHLTKGAADEEN